jgi:hypothetical protein
MSESPERTALQHLPALLLAEETHAMTALKIPELSTAPMPDTRLELVVLGLTSHAAARLGIGFGNYPLGVRYAIGALLPLCRRDDPAWPYIEKELSKIDESLGIKEEY